MKFPSFRGRREPFSDTTMWTRCPSCEEQLFNTQLEKAMRVPRAGTTWLSAPSAGQLLDEGTFEERTRA
jgi:acetyl-CoA carboxylase beta subunit